MAITAAKAESGGQGDRPAQIPALPTANPLPSARSVVRFTFCATNRRMDLRRKPIYPCWKEIGGLMKRSLVGCIVLLSAAALGQQTKSPVSDVLRTMLAGREKNTVAAFEEMPADKFGYKPTPEQMTFGHLAAHIVSSNYFFCSNVGDVPQPKTEELKETDAKDKLVAAMKASFEFCHTALAKADDSKMSDNITWFDNKPRPRAWAAVALASSWADHYGMAAMYLRLNGLLPPTAQPADKK
jgi:uncharacterized damage-inducible protein DinB